MKTAEEIIEEMFKTHDAFYSIKGVKWAMNEYAEQARKDERVKVLEELYEEFSAPINYHPKIALRQKLNQLKETK